VVAEAGTVSVSVSVWGRADTALSMLVTLPERAFGREHLDRAVGRWPPGGHLLVTDRCARPPSFCSEPLGTTLPVPTTSSSRTAVPTTSPVPRVGVFRHVAPEPPGPTTRGLTRVVAAQAPARHRARRTAPDVDRDA
jgi:hypothetical protein